MMTDFYKVADEIIQTLKDEPVASWSEWDSLAGRLIHKRENEDVRMKRIIASVLAKHFDTAETWP